MNEDRRIEKIIEDNLPAIRIGRETVASILEKYPKDAIALRPELQAVAWLVDARQPLELRDGFITSSRKYLEKRIAAMPPRTPWQRLFNRYSPQRWIFNIASPVLLLTLIALVINSLVLTARLSIPGDPFYSTKLFIEDVQLAFTFNLEDKTDLYIQFSHERTTEFVDLVLEGDYQQFPSAAERLETDIIAALHSLNNVSRQDPAIDLPMTTELRDALSNEISILKVLEVTSPTSAHPGIELAIQVAESGVLALR